MKSGEQSMNSQVMPDETQLDEELKHRITEMLLPGEEIRWVCKPILKAIEEEKLLMGPIGLFILLIGISVLFVAMNDQVLILMAGGLLLCLIGAGLFIIPKQTRTRLAKTAFVITNQRGIKIDSKPRIYHPEILRHAIREHYDDGSGNLIFEREYSSGDDGVTMHENGFKEIPDIKAAEKELQGMLSELNLSKNEKKLIQSDGTVVINPDEMEIRLAVDSLNFNNRYLIVSRSEDQCLWVNLASCYWFIINYRDTNDKSLYASNINRMNSDKVLSLLMNYLNGLDGWKVNQKFYPTYQATVNQGILEQNRSHFRQFNACLILLLCFGFYMYIDNLRFIRHAKETQGTVVDIQSDGETYQRIVAFKGNEDRLFKAKMGAGYSSPSFHVGDNVTVLYDPNDINIPPRASLKSLGFWTQVIILLCFIIIVGYFVVSIYFKSRFRVKVRKRVTIDSLFLKIPNHSA